MKLREQKRMQTVQRNTKFILRKRMFHDLDKQQNKLQNSNPSFDFLPEKGLAVFRR